MAVWKGLSWAVRLGVRHGAAVQMRARAAGAGLGASVSAWFTHVAGALVSAFGEAPRFLTVLGSSQRCCVSSRHAGCCRAQRASRRAGWGPRCLHVLPWAVTLDRFNSILSGRVWYYSVWEKAVSGLENQETWIIGGRFGGYHHIINRHF